MLGNRCVWATCALGLMPRFVIAQSETVLHEGTPVHLRLNRTISSADAQPGDSVDFEVLDEVKVGDLVVIAKGAIALGTITSAVPKRRMARGGKLDVRIDSVRVASDEKIALRGVQDGKGGGHVGVMTGAMVATGIVFFPAAPLFLFMKGKDITIPKGHEITVYTNSETLLDVEKLRAASLVRDANRTRKAITNADVLELKKAGLSDDLVVSKIASSSTDFQLDTKDLIELKDAGLSDMIISAMVRAGKR